MASSVLSDTSIAANGSLPEPHDDEPQLALEIYRLLMGCDPANVSIDDDHGFDRHVLASILAVSAAEEGWIAQRAGLAAGELGQLVAKWFPHVANNPVWSSQAGSVKHDDEIAMVRDLLVSGRSSEGEVGGWLVAMIARRSMEANHLWEDLGLRDRAELSRLLLRHFGPLAARNVKNMRWKRFFYRALCEDDGLVMCTTPVCTQCNDFDLCFGEESGESRMAERRREVALQQTGSTPPRGSAC